MGLSYGERDSFLLRLDPSVNKQVKQLAHQERTSANATICQLIEAGLSVRRATLQRGVQAVSELLIRESDPTAALALHRAVRTLVQLTGEQSEPASAATEPAPCALESPLKGQVNGSADR